jgi:excisionase family DNA binding protein
MAQGNDDIEERPAAAGIGLPRMMTLAQVQEVLNLGRPMVYALVKSGELPAAQFGPRRLWRVRQDDLEAYIEAAYAKTAERIAAGQISDGEDAPAQD